MDTKGTIFLKYKAAHIRSDFDDTCYGWLHRGANTAAHLQSLGVPRAGTGISMLAALVLLATILGVAHAATNIITTMAGTGLQGSSGNGAPPTSVSVGGPTGVALDINDNLFIAEPAHQRIRHVGPTNQPPVANAGPNQTVNEGSWSY